MDRRPHTIAELLESLASLPSDTEVVVEGCDCYGTWNGKLRTEVDQTGKLAVVICRYDGVGDD